MNKPVVDYSHAMTGPEVGKRAEVFITSAHHTLGEIVPPKWVNTSPVQEVMNNGDFITLNTYYRKV